MNSGRIRVSADVLRRVFQFPDDVEIVGVEFTENGMVVMNVIGPSLPVASDPRQWFTARYEFVKPDRPVMQFTGFE